VSAVTTTVPSIRPAAARAGLAALVAVLALGLAPGRASALTASFGVSPAAPGTGATVTFNATATGDPGQTPPAFAWSFGDGATASGPSASHAFTPAGTYTVTLTVTEVPLPVTPPATEAPPVAPVVVSHTVLVNTQPIAGFTIVPVNPLPGSGVTLTSTSTDPDGQIVAWAWDLDNNGLFNDAFTSTTTATFLTSGRHPIGLQVTDSLGGVATVHQDVVVDQPPVASFTFTPAVPLVGQAVTFHSTSTDADGTIVAQDWDLTGNGLFTDATGVTATKVFRQSGDEIVRLRVTDNRGVSTIAAVTVPVGGPPIAAFGFAPAAPTAGHPVTFTSTSRDIDGAIVAQQWDLDGNGTFTDAAGGVVQNTFPLPGIYTVALRVTDTSALTDVAFQTVAVGAPAPGPAPAAAAARPPRAVAAPRPAQPLLPFPLVRIAGRVSGRSTRIQLLEIRAPLGARIRVKCKGRGCPKHDVTAVAGPRPVRLRGMRRRLSAGAVVEVFIRANGRIGKYTRFRIRRGRAPLRSDMCLPPTTRGPAPCTA
jgi:PKD repeat protein